MTFLHFSALFCTFLHFLGYSGTHPREETSLNRQNCSKPTKLLEMRNFRTLTFRSNSETGGVEALLSAPRSSRK